MDPRAGLDGCGKSRPTTRIRSSDRPPRSESLYRLRYPGPQRPSPRSNKLYDAPSERIVIGSLRNNKLMRGIRLGQHNIYAIKLRKLDTWVLKGILRESWRTLLSRR